MTAPWQMQPPPGYPVQQIAYSCGCKILLDAYGWAVGRKNCETHEAQATVYVR